MPYRNLSLEQFAKYVGMDAREVHKLAQRGKLPGEKIAGQWRFNRARITEWLQQNMASMHRDHLEEFDAGITAHRQVHEDAPIVTPLLRVE